MNTMDTVVSTLVGCGHNNKQTGQTDHRVPYAFGIEHLGLCVSVIVRTVVRFYEKPSGV